MKGLAAAGCSRWSLPGDRGSRDGDPAEPDQQFRYPEKYLFGLALSPDSRWLALATGSKWVPVVEVATGQERLSVRHRSRFGGGSVYGVAFTPDGRRLATCGLPTTARIWDADTGKRLIEIRRSIFPTFQAAGTSSCRGWRSAPTAAGSPLIARTAPRGSSTRSPARSCFESSTVPGCHVWRSAPTAPGWSLAANHADLGRGHRRGAPRGRPRRVRRGGVLSRRPPAGHLRLRPYCADLGCPQRPGAAPRRQG